MTAKEYLNQIREEDAAINRMIRQKEKLVTAGPRLL